MNANSFNIISKQTGIPVEQIFQVCSIIAGLQKQSEEGETVQTSALQNTNIPEKKYMGFLGGDISEVTCEEDFKREDLYQSLYAQGIGKRDLAKYFQERCDEKAAELCNAVKLKSKGQLNGKSDIGMDKRTEYTGLPKKCTGNKPIGYEWIATNEKTYTLEQHGDVSRVVVACTQPVVINRILKPLDGDDEERRVEVIYQEGNSWHTIIVNLEVLLNSNKAVGLSSKGIIITRKNAGAFSEFMASMYDNSISKGELKVLYTVKQLGWVNGSDYFMPFVDDGTIMFDRADVAKSLLEAFVPHGSYETWKATYKVKENEQSDIKGFYCGNVCKPHFGAAKHGWLCIECFWNNYKW